MNNQVTSVEQSQRLLALGIPAEKASMGWSVIAGDTRLIVKVPGPYVVPAFTVADLLGMLPSRLNVDGDKLSLRIYRGRFTSKNSWDIWYERDEIEIRTCMISKGDTLISAAFEMVKTLCEDGKLFCLRLNKNRKYL